MALAQEERQVLGDLAQHRRQVDSEARGGNLADGTHGRQARDLVRETVGERAQRAGQLVAELVAEVGHHGGGAQDRGLLDLLVNVLRDELALARGEQRLDVRLVVELGHVRRAQHGHEGRAHAQRLGRDLVERVVHGRVHRARDVGKVALELLGRLRLEQQSEEQQRLGTEVRVGRLVREAERDARHEGRHVASERMVQHADHLLQQVEHGNAHLDRLLLELVGQG